ncbi:hypothetical protein AKJ37_03195 [candidate division MSBL1 archaeon SCGC-AAA259I09]|uniref:Ornithine cyclodeaminase n=3 Tax=candidate division MSBL1 TaxID=215777 RepID=A0A133UT58_9EURY|nr:hypothetical protein AKJ61_00560 [candidate division MSBL1 archaeon SCGC-AAA259B11]KXA93555.1 hypothetical protein AKJ66_01770 [candidate division MSBL1 archaeon SCGC-AAA259E22]KXA97329.1 hypothetical protein AKJ37_03195 [candidate division MSBL1 archaeon SCGC-AAA259I09]
MVLILSEEDVKSLFTMDEAIDAVEEGFKELSGDTAHLPSRLGIDIDKYEAWIGLMPAYLEELDVFGTKIIGHFPNNPEKGLPTHVGQVIINDPSSGEALAVLDGNSITAIRTGAAGGVSAKYLARTDSKTVGVIGTGVQGRSHLRAVCEVRDIKSAKAYDVDSEAREKYVEEMSKELKIKMQALENPNDVVSGADIVITATPSKEPVFDGKYLEKGSHIIAVGAYQPDMREIDDATIKKADKIVLDYWEDALESGDISQPLSKGILEKENIHSEIGEIILGEKEGRTSREEITLFETVGTATIDVSSGKRIYELAKEKEIGTEKKL